MIKFLKRVLVPNRIDVCLFVVAVHWFAVLIFLWVVPYFLGFNNGFSYPLFVFVIGATPAALAAMMRWKNGEKRRYLLLILSGLLAWGFTYAYLVSRWDFLNENAFFFTSYNRFERKPDLSEFQVGWAWYSGSTLVACVLIWGLSAFFQVSSGKVGSGFSKFRNRFAGDRTKLLLIVAGTMFAFAMLGRVFATFEVWGAGVNTILQIPIYVVIAWIAVVWLPRSHASDGKPWQKLFSFLIALSVFVTPTVVAIMVGVKSPLWQQVFPLVVGVIYTLSVVAVGNLNSQADSPVDIGPSIHSLIPILLLAFVTIGPWILDVRILVFQPPNATLQQRFELAFRASQISRRSGGRIVAMPQRSSRGYVWQVNFDDEAPADMLNILAGESSSGFLLVNLKPKFDLTPVAASSQYFTTALKDAVASRSQLEHLFGSVAGVEIQGSFEVVKDRASTTNAAIETLHFANFPPGTISDFWTSTEGQLFAKRVYISATVGPEDWPAVIQLAQLGHVTLSGGISGAVDFKQVELPTGKITLRRNYTPDGKPDPIRREILTDTEIRLLYYSELQDSPEVAIKLMFLRNSPVQFDLANWLVGSGSGSLARIAKDNQLAFKVSDKGVIEALYLPSASKVNGLGKLTELRILGFDESWTSGTDETAFGWFRMPSTPTNVSHLKSLTKLEELYFDSNFIPERTDFLKHLVSLKHLQVPRVERKATGPTGFDSCSKLESITFLGRPDVQSMRELAKVGTLKK